MLAQQKFSDPLWFAREDEYGQRVTSVVADDGSFWETIFSYPPHGPVNPSDGDGGEYYVLGADGKTIYIAGTQDASSPNITKFGTAWPLFNTDTADYPSCTELDPQTRATRATLVFRASGFGFSEIAADCIINDHFDGPGQSGNWERHIMAAGWGFLGYEAGNTIYPAWPGAPPAVIGAPPRPTTQPLANWRYPTNLIPQFPSVAGFGWVLGGKLP